MPFVSHDPKFSRLANQVRALFDEDTQKHAPAVLSAVLLKALMDANDSTMPPELLLLKYNLALVIERHFL